MYTVTICEKHNYREIVQFVYQLENFDCAACAAIADREYQEREIRAELAARRGHPSICLCPACAPWEAEYDRMQAEEDARLFVCEITSPGYCDHRGGELQMCFMSGCHHAACKAEPPF